MNKILSIILLIVVSILIFTGCNDKEEEKEIVTPETSTNTERSSGEITTLSPIL